MFFEEELGFKPARWLRNEQLDAMLDDNCIAVQPMEELIVRQTGLHLSMIRLIVAAILTVPLGFLHRAIPWAMGRHWYALITGVALLYYPFGNQVWLVIVSSLLTYVSMLIAPRLAGRLAWCIAFPFLLICMERTGDLWDTGAVDITGSLMVLVLKQVALGYNLSDSHSDKRSSEFAVERQHFKLSSPPNILHYFSYIFATGNLLSGPFFEYRDYIDFTSRKGKFADACKRDNLGAAAKSAVQCFGLATASIVASQLVAAYFTPLMLVPPQVRKLAMWQRYGIAFLLGAGKRCQYYFIWGLSEAGINASGFGFNGYKDQEKTQPKFDRYRNTQVYQVETCYSIAQVPKFWNVNTGVFLRRYVYERVGKGFVGLAVTQLVSGLWHGLREGHMLFFAMTIPLFAGSKVIYKQEKRLPKAVYESVPWKLFKWFISHAQLNIFCQTFMLQKWHLCWESIKSFHGVPHIVSLSILALGEILPVPRAYKQMKRDMAETSTVEETHREMDKSASGKSRSAGVLPKPTAAQHEELKRR